MPSLHNILAISAGIGLQRPAVVNFAALHAGIHAALAVWLGMVGLGTSGCDRYRAPSPDVAVNDRNPVLDATDATGDHRHLTGALGGVITSFGNDQYHAEAVLDDQQRLSLYILDRDESLLRPIPSQKVTVYLRGQTSGPATTLIMEADPLESDPDGQTTRLTVGIPAALQQSDLYVAVPGLMIDGQRYMVRARIPNAHRPEMPQPLPSERAAQLFLTAGGVYTEQDIQDNGAQTAQQKFANFRAQHDPNPQPGDCICPITGTKAHPECAWIIGGQRYIFCCPPCIDEFLQLAKSNPASVRSPSDYVK